VIPFIEKRDSEKYCWLENVTSYAITKSIFVSCCHIRKPPLIMKMFYFQDFLMWPARCFISQQDVLRFQNILNDEKLWLFTFDFSLLKGFQQVRVTWDLTRKDFPPTSGVVFPLFSSHPPTILVPHLLNIPTKHSSDQFIQWLERKNKLTNIPLKKKMEWGPSHCQCEERGLSLTLTSSVYICQVTTLINYQLQTLGYLQLVDNKNSFMKVYQ
jgi:hypothetical protein